VNADSDAPRSPVIDQKWYCPNCGPDVGIEFSESFGIPECETCGEQCADSPPPFVVSLIAQAGGVNTCTATDSGAYNEWYVQELRDSITALTAAKGAAEARAEKAQEDAFVRITELIGEMSWGIGIPSPVVIRYCDISGEIKTKHCEPKELEPVFEAIYSKLKAVPDYNPLPNLRAENNQLEARVAVLEKAIDTHRGNATALHMALIVLHPPKAAGYPDAG